MASSVDRPENNPTAASGFLRLQTRLLLALAALFVFSIGLMALVAFNYQVKFERAVKTDLHGIVRAVHFSTRYLSSERSRDAAALERFIVDAVTRNTAVREISVVNRNQEIVASSDPRKIGTRQAFSWGDTVASEEFSSTDSVDWYDLTMPIIQNQKVIGQVHASVTATNLGELVRTMSVTVILTAAVIFALAVFLSYLAVNYLLRPLTAMGAVAQRVADGRYDRPFQRPGTDEIGRIMAVFNTMTEQLAEQKQREEKLHALERRAILSETAAVLAHEIRNPLNLINLTAGHMARQFLPEDPKSRETYLGLTENLKAQVAHLNTMVGEFLTAGKPTVLKKQTVALRALIEQTGVLARQKWAVRDIRLENAMDESVTAFVDPEQMRLVFLNLFINAAEAIGQGGTIGVAVASQPGQLVIRVYDTGPGIEEQYLEKIFEPYFMKRPDGTGLGLTLVRRIVEEHGGTVTARNREEGGMCFTITLPRKEPA